jgi:hypothetical protein
VSVNILPVQTVEDDDNFFLIENLMANSIIADVKTVFIIVPFEFHTSMGAWSLFKR